MRSVPPIGAGAVIAAIVPALAQSAGESVSADEIIRTLVGKTCTTKAGAKFTFTRDGHYAYAGLWANRGHYAVNAGSVTISLDSGIEREFAISKKDDVLYMEETALSCR